jgi:hypothetical protein
MLDPVKRTYRVGTVSHRDIANHHLRLEFIYHLQLSRKNASEPLSSTDNIFRLNLTIGMKHGLLQRLSGADDE